MCLYVIRITTDQVKCWKDSRNVCYHSILLDQSLHYDLKHGKKYCPKNMDFFRNIELTVLYAKCLNLAKFLAGNIILSIFFLYYFSESIWCDHSNCTSRVWISRLWQQPRRPRMAYWNDSNEWPRFGFNRYWRMESACSAQIQFPFGNFTKRRRKYDLPQIQTPGTFMYLHSYYGWNDGGVFLGEPKR